MKLLLNKDYIFSALLVLTIFSGNTYSRYRDQVSKYESLNKLVADIIYPYLSVGISSKARQPVLQLLGSEKILRLNAYDRNGKLLISYPNFDINLPSVKDNFLIWKNVAPIASSERDSDFLGRVEIYVNRLDFLSLALTFETLFTLILLVFLLTLYFNTISKKRIHSDYIEKFSNFISNVFSQDHRYLDISHYSDPKWKELITRTNKLLDVFEENQKRLRDAEIKNIEIETKAKVDQAIARTTQMLAHDVRKPFSMLQAVLNIISDLKSSDEIHVILSESVQSISSAINSVNGMIADVMEVGAESRLNLQQVEPEKLINESLAGIFSYNEEADVAISYNFQHRHLIVVDVLKVGRIFANIFGNAVELMNGQGKLWINTIEKDDMICFCLGNSKTYIAEEDLPHLFEAFYTKNKKGGTGLGLAIAKKVTEAHGGTIWCESSQATGTEFYFTLPKSDSNSIDHSAKMPHHSSGFFKKPKLLSQPIDQEVSNQQSQLEEVLLSRMNQRFSSLRLAIVDDESIYIRSIEAIIKASPALSKLVEFQSFSQSESLIRRILKGDQFDIIIFDVDYGTGKISGFEATQQLRVAGFGGKICIHSNRGTLEYQPRAMGVGAELFLPKPMTKEHLLSLVLSILQNSDEDLEEKRKVILFEDEAIYQRQWIRLLGKERLEIFRSWNEFVGSWTLPSDWAEIDYIVTDYYLADSVTGVEVAKQLRELNFNRPLFLSSNIEGLTEVNCKEITAIVPKDCVKAKKEISEYLHQRNKDI